MSTASIVAIAINRIHRKGKTPDVVNAKTAFRFDTDEYQRLKKLSAVRAATADEIAAYEAEQARLNGADILAAQAAQAAAGNTEATTERKPAKVVGKKAAKPAEPAEPEKTEKTEETAGAGADGDGHAGQGGENADDI
ncbi:hypothetical protein [Mesorhizobium sp. B2-8-9]|uniref:hypothetical protein n=1 Tax=Mesorhizobium sp. B2-8-9 TaxID=2589899 RepID=UPI00112D0EAB|nr:hypothetical protein [Mesorhizobium sp. B2-8-9]TPI86357.1 hypothetical protein FJ423_00605 [Mesorhizobium sp. B2-8-9]